MVFVTITAVKTILKVNGQFPFGSAKKSRSIFLAYIKKIPGPRTPLEKKSHGKKIHQPPKNDAPNKKHPSPRVEISGGGSASGDLDVATGVVGGGQGTWLMPG